MLASSLVVGGILPLSARVREQWPPCGAWRLPVGDPYAIQTERPPEPGPFFVLRGVEWDGQRASHQGADLGCGRAGLFVRAAAAGVVVLAADHGDYGGYGTHVVLAHRLPDGVLCYSVYAHLRVASLRVRAGQRVQAGQVLGRVGMTGRATTPHLHFEVRAAGDPNERWEFARVEDPLAFVEERLPTHRADTTGVEAYLEWGECAGLLAPGARAEDALTREAWWRMLAAALRGPLLDPGLEPEALRDSLDRAGLLREDHSRAGGAEPASWPIVARDLGRARAHGVRTGPAPLRRAAHRGTLRAAFGSEHPTGRLGALSGREGGPTLEQAVLLLADLAGPRPEPPKPAPPRRPVRRLTPRPGAGRDSARVADSTLAADSARASRTRATPGPAHHVRSRSGADTSGAARVGPAPERARAPASRKATGMKRGVHPRPSGDTTGTRDSTAPGP